MSALLEIGLSAAEATRGALHTDVVLGTPDGRSFEVQVKAASIATAEQIGHIR